MKAFLAAKGRRSSGPRRSRRRRGGQSPIRCATWTLGGRGRLAPVFRREERVGERSGAWTLPGQGTSLASKAARPGARLVLIEIRERSGSVQGDLHHSRPPSTAHAPLRLAAPDEGSPARRSTGRRLHWARGGGPPAYQDLQQPNTTLKSGARQEPRI